MAFEKGYRASNEVLGKITPLPPFLQSIQLVVRIVLYYWTLQNTMDNAECEQFLYSTERQK